MDEINIAVGGHVRVVDEVGKVYDGLVTAIHGGTSKAERDKSYEENGPSYGWDEEHIERCKSAPFMIPCINVVVVSDDPSKHDPYGRQIDRHLTSLAHRSTTTANGRYYEVI